ncbi:hypothetical protein Bca52824_026807 [Brassica carinata]|uniref:Uncharacterized protein n=1 Tax=Brassica carinata TaxID=52824 RepID=A0A8X7SLA4_BRACI|nr:hypothetical protein Bca52824_026807 [Brassica carinata]
MIQHHPTRSTLPGRPAGRVLAPSGFTKPSVSPWSSALSSRQGGPSGQATPSSLGLARSVLPSGALTRHHAPVRPLLIVRCLDPTGHPDWSARLPPDRVSLPDVSTRHPSSSPVRLLESDASTRSSGRADQI